MNQDEALLLVREQDMRERLNGGQKLIDFLTSSSGDLSQWNNIDRIVDSLAVYWVSTSNHKVALLGLDILSLLVERLQDDFQVYYNSIHNTLVDRLGDQKDQVRDAAVTLLTNIMEVVSSPVQLFEKLASGFSHKAWRVREGLCRLLIAALNRFGAKPLHLSKLSPHIAKLMTDPTAEVREIALTTFVEMYRYVGEKVRQDVAKKGLPAPKLQLLYERFDHVLQTGDMLVGSETGSIASSVGSFDSVDSGGSSFMSRTQSTSTIGGRMSRASEPDVPRPSSSQPRKSTSAIKSLHTRSNAGGVDEESFVRDFDQNLPSVRLFSPRDTEAQLNQINTIISDERRAWEERTKALRTLRAVAITGGEEFDAFYNTLRSMEPALQLNAKDLRSQVVRETCVTIGFLSSTMKQHFEHTACVLLPTLFSMVPNSAKVTSTSAVLAIRTILKHTHAHRIVPIVCSYATSRTTSIRRHTFTFMSVMFQNWLTHTLEKHVSHLKESVQKGIGDADSDTREEARRAWHDFNQHFPADADDVFNGLNPSQQKLIKGRVPSMENLSTTSSKKSRASSTTTGTGPRRVITRAPPSAGLRGPTPSAANKFPRSRSAIDPASVKRSQMKALSSGYGTVGRTKRLNNHAALNKTFNNRGRENSRPAISQPGSRSNSPPSNRLLRTVNVAAYDRTEKDGAPQRILTRTPPSSPTPTRRSRIPVSNSRTGSRAGSRLGSRATSPTGSRSGSPPRYKGVRTPSGSSFAAPMRVLPKGKEGEQVLNDALARKLHRKQDTGGFLSDDDDNMSDTSSVCSERSYTSRNGFKRQPAQLEDVGEILQLCQSTQWTERKEGLMCLHSLICRKKEFSRLQLKRVLEIFNRMFADPHGKVFSLFLEMLPDFINNYNEEIREWLYVLLTQLLKKMGTELLGSVQGKVLKTLQITRESFPTDLQFNILSRYVIDQTQRPNLKVKVALLHYMLELVMIMEPNEIINTSDTRLALSRLITWTTEPKSQDVRKTAEALVGSIFELNAPAFTNMIRVLPKTFQDGAMKVLQSYKTSNDGMPSMMDSGQVMGVVGVAPGHNIVGAIGDAGTVDLMSPRGSSNSSERMNTEEITENFRDITAGIQRLRMDSNVDEVVLKKDNLASPKLRSELTANLRKPPSARDLLGKENKYNPSDYSSPGKQLLMSGIIDDDAFNEDIPLEGPDSNIADVAFAFTSGKDKRRALDDLSAVLRGSDVVAGLAASQQQIQWDKHFKTILSGTLEILRSGNVELQVTALATLKEMLRHLSHRFASFAEVTVLHILQVHRDANKEVARAADDCGTALCSLLPSTLCIKVLSPLARSSSGESAQACLKMLTNAINRSAPEELTDQVVSDLVPGLLQCYDNMESGIRKAAVFCLVALHRVIGDANLCRHLGALSGGKMKLLQLYIKRSQATDLDG